MRAVAPTANTIRCFMPCEYVSVRPSTNSDNSNRSISRSIARATCALIHAIHAANKMQDFAARKFVVKKRLVRHIADQRDGVARLTHKVVAANTDIHHYWAGSGR